MIKQSVFNLFLFVLLLSFLACGKEKAATITVKVTNEISVQPEKKDNIPVMVSDSTKETGCAILRKGAFKYEDTDGDEVIVKIIDNVSTEEHKGGKYIIMSKLTWKNECEYDNMLIMSTVPKVKLEPGTVMSVTIDKVEGKNIYFTATAKGKSYHNMLTKI